MGSDDMGHTGSDDDMGSDMGHTGVSTEIRIYLA
jgi:hypothetical protein